MDYFFVQKISYPVMTECPKSGMIGTSDKGYGGSAVLKNQYNVDCNITKNMLAMLTPAEDGINYSLAEEQDMQELGLLMKIMDEMPGGFFIYRAEEHEEIIYANKAMLRIFGCNTMEEFREHTGNSFRGIVYPDDLDEVEKSIKYQIEKSHYDLDYVEYRITRKDGEIRWIEDYGHFVRSGLGDIFYVFAGDATEKIVKKEKEKEEIRREQFRRQVVIEALSIDYESIFYVNMDENRIQAYRFSDRIEYQFENGCMACEFTGFADKYIERWVYPEDRELVARANSPQYIRERLSKSRMFHVNYRIVKDGRPEYLQLRVVNVGDEENISRLVMGYRSVDDEVMHEMEQRDIMEDTLRHVKSANEAKNTFLANMSHDMRTPMNAIMGYNELAKKHMSEEDKLAEYLRKTEEAGEQLLALINDVLEISRMEAGGMKVEEEKCNLFEVVKEVHDIILPEAESKNITYFPELSGVRHKHVYSDSRKLLQVLLKLMENAVKYTQEGGCVSLRVTEKKEASKDYACYQFVVEDNGIGIDRDFQEHIFEPFERQQNTTLSGVPGTGLGLTIAKNSVEMMGGTIELESIEGKGSRFVVTLSLRIQERQPEDDEKAKERVHELKKRRLLLVEDNDFNMEIETELLTEAGYVVDTAVDGSIAVDKVRNSGPDDYEVILMDIQMPVMDGYQAAEAIRSLEDEEKAAIPIIALSANTFDEDRKRSMECGMNAHIAKPVDIAFLAEIIEEMCGK